MEQIEHKLAKQGARFTCKIVDWHDLHNGYTLRFRPGYTALVGPNVGRGRQPCCPN